MNSISHLSGVFQQLWQEDDLDVVTNSETVAHFVITVLRCQSMTS